MKKWPKQDYEIRILEKAYPKKFKPTIARINKLSKGGNYKIKLPFIDLKGKKNTRLFEITLIEDNLPGLKFKITLPKMLNVGGVEYKDSYGLIEELTLVRTNNKIFIPEDSVIDFETRFPAIPQFLEGRFIKIRSLKQFSEISYCGLIIPTKDKDMIFPTYLLEYNSNHLKFDIPNWDRQMTLIGLPIMTTKGMYTELNIKNIKFHYYALEPINSQVIDSINKISIDLFKKVSYAIRLCFAFLTGKFYTSELNIIASEKSDFSKINYFEYEAGKPSIVTGNQIINPTFFFQIYSKQDKDIKEQWKDYHKMFDTKIFSSMCEKVLDSPEFMRSLELIVNAGAISDPVQKGALYSVCIETITELLKSENEEVFKPIPDKKLWMQFFNDIQSYLEKIKPEISEEGFKILTAKISNLNSPTNRDKLGKPFKLVGIELTEDELKILEQRNSYLHGGQPEDKNWIIISNLNALKLRYLIGMLILKYFNYTGHYIDISAWYMLHDRESRKVVKSLSSEELIDAYSKIQLENLKTMEEIQKVKEILEQFEKFYIAALAINNIVKII